MDKQRNREDQIFEIIVRAYVETAEPVGSRTISRHFDVGLSPASIRNIMADLEEQGFLKQPHTSAGRIPTDKGYRYYVDQLMEPFELNEKEKQHVNAELSKERTPVGVLEKASKVVSELTQNTVLTYVKGLKRMSSLLEELIREAEQLNAMEENLLIDGAYRLLSQPEFQNALKVRRLFQEIEEKYYFLQLLLQDLNERGVKVHIGSEHGKDTLEDVSMVVKDLYLGHMPVCSIAVVGPTRMHYPKNVAVVNFVTECVCERMKDL